MHFMQMNTLLLYYYYDERIEILKKKCSKIAKRNKTHLFQFNSVTLLLFIHSLSLTALLFFCRAESIAETMLNFDMLSFLSWYSVSYFKWWWSPVVQNCVTAQLIQTPRVQD